MKYWGKQTKQALENFPFPVPPVHLELIYAMTEIKKAAAFANLKAGDLSKDSASAIVVAADEIIRGKHDDQFILPSIQGGAGTSINMNVNEVLASRATAILKKKKISVHPNDHVNMSQSTNDVNPSALKLALMRLTHELLTATDTLIDAFAKKADEYKNIRKLARTHLQDAIPTTAGAEFDSYKETIIRDKKRIVDATTYLYDLNLGGTAIGNAANASSLYIAHVYRELKKQTKIPFRKATNLMSQTSSSSDFCHLSAVITILSMDISKIATDLRILSSGPHGGIGEIILEALQPGSSIMPGKVNPVAPESMNQIYYVISGKNLTIHQAAEASCLELAIMFPVIADSLITSIKLLISGIEVFAKKCILTLKVNKERCKENLERSTAYATLLTPKFGYDKVSRLVQKALKENKTLREVILEEDILSEKEFDHITQL
ncbi:aspartate ammonia-lyase [Candidatus Roizmanbacteria bacterium]|nr:aspartate ammonia-lyase [Candidatus Roizmanbacteria bacterium]